MMKEEVPGLTFEEQQQEESKEKEEGMMVEELSVCIFISLLAEFLSWFKRLLVLVNF